MSDGHIFICYRRDDSAGYARAIHDQLVERFSQARVFMDVDTIEPGLPFDEAINQAVGSCEILLVLIGKRWMEQAPGAGSRLDDEKDFVRLEIAAALSRNVRVIPVLLDGSRMPSEESLPEPLRALTLRNAIEISNSRFKSDANRLVDAVGKVLDASEAPPGRKRTRSLSALQLWVAGGVALVALFFSITYFYFPTSASDLCHGLKGKSININANNHRGVVGPAGISLEERELGRLTFNTLVVFAGNGGVTARGEELKDPLVGVCEGGTLSLTRTLRNGTSQHYVGSLYKADNGRIEVRGSIDNGQYSWSGWISGPDQK